MSLNYNLKGIKDYEQLCYKQNAEGKRRLTEATEAIIFATMAVGIGKITEKNYVEFYLRLRAWSGGFARDAAGMRDGTYRMLIIADIERHIGLQTNVIDEPKSKWLLRLYNDTLKSLQWIEHRRKQSAIVVATPDSLDPAPAE